MRYRKLTADGDYSFGNGQKDFYNNVPEAVGQAVETTLLLWVGEWFLNINSGTPYLQGILGKYSQADANTIIKNQITSVEGVTGISKYSGVLDPDNRFMQVSATIDTIYGPTEIDINNYRDY